MLKIANSNGHTNGAIESKRMEPLSSALPVHLPTTHDERVTVLHQLLGEQACRQLGIYYIPAGFKLSVVIPCYNEERWIREVVRRVRAVPLPKEIIIVDDCSKDGTRAILRELESDEVRVVLQSKNQGKGAAPAHRLHARNRRRDSRAGRRPRV